jgi:hypothetical protein
MTSNRARCTGPPLTSVGSSDTPTSCTARCSMAARRFCTRASRSAHLMQGAFWRVIAEQSRQHALHRSNSFPCDPPTGPGGQAHRALRLVRLPRALPRRGTLRSRDAPLAEDKLGVPVIDHWWQTETGWPVAANCLGIEPLPDYAGIADPCRTGLGYPGLGWRRHRAAER